MAAFSSSSSSSRFVSVLAALLLFCCVPLGRSDLAKDKEECQDTLVGLATCITYVEGKAKAPTPDCCSGLSRILKTNRKCLCVLIKDRDEPGLGLTFNATLAMSLPTVCRASGANISECPVLLGLPPHSKEAQIFEQFGSGNKAATGGSSAAAVEGSSSTGKDDAKGSGGGRSKYAGERAATPVLFLIATLVFASWVVN
ncbi:hypothetical protein Cni_G28464 [Canna indica]|uniref:Bifunctional inhibitor/plant lipid transfer protein/seed storage helical domain-containing protein n=1 Tax=Canna indica TaxID=4628 RepID=A0AAQ3L2K4_9LILI|nr:hypothetical protein Cni_G28464 [Canna indica]